MKVKVLTSALLRDLNDSSIAAGRNRNLEPDRFGDRIDPTGKHVVFLAMDHNDREVRLGLMLKVRGTDVPVETWLDVSFAEFAAIPELDTEGPRPKQWGDYGPRGMTRARRKGKDADVPT